MVSLYRNRFIAFATSPLFTGVLGVIACTTDGCFAGVWLEDMLEAHKWRSWGFLGYGLDGYRDAEMRIRRL